MKKICLLNYLGIGTINGIRIDSGDVNIGNYTAPRAMDLSVKHRSEVVVKIKSTPYEKVKFTELKKINK